MPDWRSSHLLTLLLCAALATSVQLSPVAAAAAHAHRRELQQACPALCSKCAYASTQGGFICAQCSSNLVVAKDGSCGCHPGQFINTDSGECQDCHLGFFCPGGTYTKSLLKNPCNWADNDDTKGLTTIRTKSRSRNQCVNKPGYRLGDSEGRPIAVACTGNTFSTGYKQQHSCDPCPAGLQVPPDDKWDDLGITGRTTSRACVAPPGYFLSGPGRASRCPIGEYQSSYSRSTSCSKCNRGATTRRSATSADDCSVAFPGFYLSAASTPKICPQKSWCAGGTTGKQTCPGGLWTIGLGSKSASDCLVPPGYKWVSNTNNLTECGDGEFQPNWGRPADITSCQPCGTNIRSDPTIPLDKYGNSDPTDNEMSGSPDSMLVRGASSSCYISKGMGMMQVPAANGQLTYVGVFCSLNNWGVEQQQYDLAASPCQACPTGTVTIQDASKRPPGYPVIDLPDNLSGLNKEGYYSPDACVTRPGWSFDGFTATVCPAGTYSPGYDKDNTDADPTGQCQECPEGLTTSGPEKSAASDDCSKLTPGYGTYGAEEVLCPMGTYRGAGADKGTACESCPNYRSTSGLGAASLDDCNICKDGYGSSTANPVSCQICSGDDGQFGPPTRSSGSYACLTCASGLFTYTFPYGGSQNSYSPAAVSPSGAVSASQCYAQFAQIDNGNWRLDQDTTKESWQASRLNTLEACAQACTGNCQLFTFDYAAPAGQDNCFRRYSTPPQGNDPSSRYLVAFKVLGSPLTQSVRPAAIGPGVMTLWDDTKADQLTTPDTTLAYAGTLTLQGCMQICAQMSTCAAVRMDYGDGGGVRQLQSCQLVEGVVEPGSSKRSLVRAVPSKINVKPGAAGSYPDP